MLHYTYFLINLYNPWDLIRLALIEYLLFMLQLFEGMEQRLDREMEQRLERDGL